MTKYAALKTKAFVVVQLLALIVLFVALTLPVQGEEAVKVVPVNTLIINDQEASFPVQPADTPGEWLVSLRDLAEETGLVVGWMEETKTVRIKDKGVIVYLQVDSMVALVNSAEKFLPEPLRLVQGRLLVPLGFLAEIFDYQLVDSAEGLRLTTPTETITGIKFTIEDGRPVIKVTSSGVLRYESHLLTQPDRIVLDLHDTKLDLNGAVSGYSEITGDALIQGIRWDQYKPRTTRIVIDLKKSVGYEIWPLVDENGLLVSLFKQIEGISFQRIFGKAQLEISGTGTVDYSLSYLSNPDRVVIDLEKATLATPAQEIIVVDDPLVKKMRISQYLPHIVRAVLEVNYPVAGVASPSNDPRVIILELVKQITGVTVETSSGQQSVFVAGSGLAQYAVEYFPDLAQILVDIPSAVLRTDQPRHVFQQGPISDIKLLQVAPTAVQVQIGLRGYLGHQAYQNADGLRIAINSSPLSGRRIVLDPGHGGTDPGAIGSSGLREKDVVLDIALRLRDLLKAEGAEVIMVRDGDYYVPLAERATVANNTRADVFVSIHINSSVNRNARGTETYYYYADPKGQELAALVQRNMLDQLGLSNRAPRPNQDFVVLKETMVPAILSEVAFISNREEEKLLRQSSFRQKAADALYRALQAYFGGPTWRLQERLPTDFGGPPAPFTWEPLKIAPTKPGEGILDKVNVIEIH